MLKPSEINEAWVAWKALDGQYRKALFSPLSARAALKRVLAAVPDAKAAVPKQYDKDPVRALSSTRSAEGVARIPWRRHIVEAVARSARPSKAALSLKEKADTILADIAEAACAAATAHHSRKGLHITEDDKQNQREAVLRAAHLIDPGHAHKARTYLVSAAIISSKEDSRYERNQYPVRINPRRAGARIRAIQAAMDRMATADHDCGVEAIANETGLPVSEVEALWPYAFPVHNPSMPRDVRVEQAEEKGLLPASSAADPEDEAIQAETLAHMRAALGLLDAGERAVLTRVDMGGDTVQAAAQALGITAVEATRLRDAGLRKMKTLMNDMNRGERDAK